MIMAGSIELITYREQVGSGNNYTIASLNIAYNYSHLNKVYEPHILSFMICILFVIKLINL